MEQERNSGRTEFPLFKSGGVLRSGIESMHGDDKD